MFIEIGHVEAIFRYPVKSMAGERLDRGRQPRLARPTLAAREKPIRGSNGDSDETSLRIATLAS